MSMSISLQVASVTVEIFPEKKTNNKRPVVKIDGGKQLDWVAIVAAAFIVSIRKALTDKRTHLCVRVSRL